MKQRFGLSKFYVSILLCFFIASNSFASYQPEPLSLDEKAYIQTKAMCSAHGFDIYVVRGEVFSNAFSEGSVLFSTVGTLATFFSSFDFKKTFEYSTDNFNQLRINSKLDQLISTQGYYEAIHECFNNDEFQEKLFFIGLLVTDLTAKLSALISDITLLRVLWLLFRVISAASYAEMPQRFMWCWVILDLASKNRSIAVKIMDFSFLSTMIGSLIAGYNFEKEINQIELAAEMEKNDSTMRKLRSQNEEYRLMLRGASPQKQTVLMMFIKMNDESLEVLQRNYKPI